MFIYFLNLLLVLVTSPYLFYTIQKLRRTIPALPNAGDLQGVTTGFGRSLSLLLLGESAIAGVGVDSNHDALAGQISERLSQQIKMNISWEVMAQTGYDAKQVFHTLVPQLKDHHYDVILIQLAANDTFKLNPPNRYKASIEKIIHHLRQKYPKAKIIFINNPPVRDMAFPPLMQYILGNIMDQYAKTLTGISAEMRDVFFIEDRVRLSDWRRRFPDKTIKDFFSDGVHPSSFTFSVWAVDICNYIKTHRIIEEHMSAKK